MRKRLIGHTDDVYVLLRHRPSVSRGNHPSRWRREPRPEVGYCRNGRPAAVLLAEGSASHYFGSLVVTYALGALLLGLIIAWATGALKNGGRRNEVLIAVAVLVCGNVLLVSNDNALLGTLGIVAIVGAIVALFRLRPRSQPKT